MDTVFNTLQARHDNATPCEPTAEQLAHEELTDTLTEISELLLQVERKVDEVHSLCGEDYCQEHLAHLTFQLDTTTARSEISQYFNNDEV